MSNKEDRLIGELYYDLKGKKKKRLDWMSIAEKCKQAVNLFGSAELAAKKLRVSVSLLNSIIRLTDLDPRVQAMVRNREILFDTAQRLNAIKVKDRQFEVAQKIKGLQNKKQREIIQHAIRYPDMSLDDYRDKVAGEKVKRENITILVIPLQDELYRSLMRESNLMKRPVEKVVPEAIRSWLEGRNKA